MLSVGLMYVLSVGLKTRSIRGYPGPPLERVFNRIDILAESLYARARVGIVCWGYRWSNGSISGGIQGNPQGVSLYGQYKGYLHRVQMWVQDHGSFRGIPGVHIQGTSVDPLQGSGIRIPVHCSTPKRALFGG